MKKIFIALLRFSRSLVSMVNDSNLTTYISFNNEPFMTISYFIYLILLILFIFIHYDEYNHGLRYYPLLANLDRCNRSYNHLDDLS